MGSTCATSIASFVPFCDHAYAPLASQQTLQDFMVNVKFLNCLSAPPAILVQHATKSTGQDHSSICLLWSSQTASSQLSTSCLLLCWSSIAWHLPASKTVQRQEA